MKPETKYVWHPLKRELDKLGWDYDRLENGAGLGMPDLNIYVPKIEVGFDGKIKGDVWAELKYLTGPIPKALNTRVSLGLRPEQFIWLQRAKRAGRKVYLVVRIGDKWWYWDDIPSFERAKWGTLWSELKVTGHQIDGPGGFLSLFT